MVFSGRNQNRSIDFVMTSLLSTKENKNTNNRRQKARPKSSSLTSAENEDFGRQVKTGPKCKMDAVSPQSWYVEDVYFDQKNIDKERWFDESESMWLSSDTTSTSSFFEEHRLSSPFHLSVDRQTISWLANLADSYLSLGEGMSFLDGHGTNSTENLEKTRQKNPHEERNITDRNASVDSSIDILQSTNPDCYSPVSDMEKNSFLHPFEDFKWILDSEAVLLSNSTTIGVKDEKSQNDSSLQQGSEVAEPLFWPFEWKFDWTSQDICKYFAMSPKKCITDSKVAYTLQLPDKEKNLRDGCRRRLVFNKEKLETNVVRRVNSMPVRKANKLGMKTEVRDDRKAYSPNSVHRKREVASNQELPIENILGLSEFDGHEGIDSEFSEDIFSMDDSL